MSEDLIGEALNEFNQKEKVQIDDLADIEKAVTEASKKEEEEKARVAEEASAYEKRVSKMSDDDVNSVLKTIEHKWQESETDETLAEYISKHPQAFAFVAAMDKRHAGLKNVSHAPLYMSEAVNRVKNPLAFGDRVESTGRTTITSHFRG